MSNYNCLTMMILRKCRANYEELTSLINNLKANSNRISGSISTSTKDYIINYQDLQGIGMTEKLALPTLIALCSIALGRPVVSNLAILEILRSAAR